MKEITQEEIKKFMEGRDPMERIVNLSYQYRDPFITVFYRDEQDRKCSKQEPFYPFVWATRSACLKLCDGNRHEVSSLLRKYDIGIKKLSNTSIDGEVKDIFDDGYLFLFYSQKAMSYTHFLDFFKEAKNPVYNKKDKNGNDIPRPEDEERQYLAVTPQEQFMISTGKRFFKGYDDYNQPLRMIFDLETEGIDPRTKRIKLNGIRLNRPVTIRGKEYQNFEKIFRISGNTKEEKDKSELKVIDTMLRIIYTFRPDIITAHNGENFDWNFIIVRCEVLGTSLEEISKPYFDGKGIRKDKKESILKLGGEIETYYQTIVPNTIITDSLHAVRRAQALDSNMLKGTLKYATHYAKMDKPNRVYVPGDIIDDVLVDETTKYAFCNDDGDWYILDENTPDSDGKFIKGKGEDSIKVHKRNFLADGYEIVSGRYIVERYLLDDLWECDKVEWKYNTTNFLICKILPVPYKKCTTMGTAGQWKALLLAWSYENGLAIPKAANSGAFTGGLSRLMRTGYVKNVIKLDYNSLYPSIILTWGISDETDLLKSMLKMLEYVLTTRELYKGIKKSAGKIVDKLKGKVQDGTATPEEISEYKKASAEYSLADGKQMQMKCLGNSFFGSYGSNNGSVFPWKSPKCAEQTTCTGRQSLRLMISHFKHLGYEPIVGDTDGFNFQLPDESSYRYTKEHPYIGKGSNREVKLGKEYVGYEADVAEFNDLYMHTVYSPNGVQKMGLGIDEIVSATINFSRKNYADYFPENPYPEDVKMVGNTIKSKKMPEYISKFLGKGVRMLLREEGQNFLNEYYDYIEKIYNYQIPLKDIASKGKIKKSVEEYKKDIKTITKAGRPKSRQAWYELAIKNKLKVDNGDTIYYINTGTAKSHPDVKKIVHYYQSDNEITKGIDKEYNKYKKGKNKNEITPKAKWIKETYPDYYTEDEIILNCGLLPRDVIDNENDVFCEDVDIEYNVPKYITQFNNRIKPLLVCFSREIRDEILISNPDDRKYFTDDQCKLVSGEPNKLSDQDTYEQLMTMEDKEIRFWTKYNLVPPFVEECKMGKWEDIVEDYNDRMEKEKKLGINIEREIYSDVINKLTEEEFTKMIEDNEIPASILRIVDIDEKTGNFVSKKYPDIVIGYMSDLYEYSYQKNEAKEYDYD